MSRARVAGMGELLLLLFLRVHLVFNHGRLLLQLLLLAPTSLTTG